jgi:tight adherence protein C
MNAQLILSLGFGIGIAGIVFSFSLAPEGLASRIGFIKNPVVTKVKPSLIRLISSKTSQFTGKKSSPRIQRALFELPEILDLLAVCLSSGDSIYRALSKVVPRAEGELANELTKILRAVEFGAPLATEIAKLPEALPHAQFSELSSKISLSLSRGTPLAAMLQDQAQSARAEIRNQLIRQAGKNETRMLIPLVFLILPVTVLFAIYPSLRLLNLNYF